MTWRSTPARVRRWSPRAVSAAVALALPVVLLSDLPKAPAVPAADAAAGNGRTPLRWTPPDLTRPTRIRLGGGFSLHELDDRRDYVLRFPKRAKRGATVIKGGRNIVVRGGSVKLPRGASADVERRAIYIKDVVGIVHLEGLHLTAARGASWDAIVVNAPRATVQIENVRVDNVHGSYDGWHADVVQLWGGAKEVRIDRMSATTSYQGLQIPLDLGAIERVKIRNVDIGYSYQQPGSGGYLLWLTQGADTCRSYPVSLANVYLTPKPGRSLADSAWPPPDAGLACGSAATPTSASWPRLPIRGAVRRGPPPGGDFVPRGAAGLDYAASGYAGRR